MFAYVRSGTLLIVLNFSKEFVEYNLPEGAKVDPAELVVETDKESVAIKAGVIHLQPYAGALYRL